MSLEAATYLDDFVSTNPAGGDGKAEGDDHIRLLKTVLKNTFPSFAGRFSRWQTKTGSYTGVATDNWSTIDASGALTYNLTAAATLGNGWTSLLYARVGAITIDPAGAETVNGAATVTIPIGYTGLVSCDGTKFLCAVFSPSAPLPSGGGVVTGAVTTSGAGTILGLGAGVRMLFQQTSAPTGWTKEANATYNDAALRIVTGSASTGGASGFSTVFAAGRSTNNDGNGTTTAYALTIADIPSHSHQQKSRGSIGVRDTAAGGSSLTSIDVTTLADQIDNGPLVTEATGGGGSHTHATPSHSHGLPTFGVKFADCIIATKD